MIHTPLTHIKTCKCGGQLCVGLTKKVRKSGTIHQTIICRSCGAWNGGFITKTNTQRGGVK